MTQNAHDEARELIALGEECLSEAQQSRLRAHLHECESCRQYADAVSGVVHTLRSLPLAADSRLVRATQMRVRFHAERLQETRQRFWMVAVACLGVGLSGTLTVPLLWQLFAWIGEWAGVSTLVWQAGFIFFLIVPALAVGALLLVRGAHLTNNAERSRHWR